MKIRDNAPVIVLLLVLQFFTSLYINGLNKELLDAFFFTLGFSFLWILCCILMWNEKIGIRGFIIFMILQIAGTTGVEYEYSDIFGAILSSVFYNSYWILGAWLIYNERNKFLFKLSYNNESVEELINRADTFILIGDYRSAEANYLLAANIYPADWRVWYGMVKVVTRNLTILDNKFKEYYDNAKLVASGSERTKLDNLVAPIIREFDRIKKVGEEAKNRRREFMSRNKKKITISFIVFIWAVAGLIIFQSIPRFKYIKVEGGYELVGCSIPESCIDLEIPTSHFNKPVVSVNLNGFYYIEKLSISSNLERIKYDHLGSRMLSFIQVDSENRFFSDIDGVLYNKQKSELYLYPVKSDNKTFNLPDTVEEIRHGALDNRILNLTVINVGEDNDFYSSLDGILFNKEKTELYIYPSMKQTRYYIIPSSVKTINSFAFYNYHGKVWVPKTVVTIENKGVINLENTDTIYIEAEKDSEYFVDWHADWHGINAKSYTEVYDVSYDYFVNNVVKG